MKRVMINGQEKLRNLASLQVAQMESGLLNTSVAALAKQDVMSKLDG